VAEIRLDGQLLPQARLPLIDDGREHEVRVRLEDLPVEIARSIPEGVGAPPVPSGEGLG
jgi:hypothetical protein